MTCSMNAMIGNEELALVRIVGNNDRYLIGKTSDYPEVYISFEGMEKGHSFYTAWKSMWCRLIGETDGVPVFSPKEYVESFQGVAESFKAKKRNVYMGSLKNVTEKIAFYMLENTNITVGVSSQNLCLNRTLNLMMVNLPREIPIVITQVNEATGLIGGSTKYGFGSFNDNIERLHVQVGSEMDAYISNQLPDGSGVCVLGPNLTTLLEPCRADRWVRVRVTKLDCETRRMKVDVIETLPYRAMDYNGFVFVPDELPAWVDMEDIDRLLRPAPRRKTVETVTEQQKAAKPYAISWDEFLSEESPFKTRDGELIDRGGMKPMPLFILQNEIAMGRIKDIHRYFAHAAATLKVGTSWQLAVQVKLDHPDLEMGEKEPHKVLEKLTRMSVLSKMRLENEEGKGMLVYCPGPQYRVLMGESACMPNYLLTTDDSGLIKERLATNQLALGVRKAWPEAAITSNLKVEDGDRYFFVSHAAQHEGKMYWMTAFRKNHYFRFEEALVGRWSQVIGNMKTEEKPVLLVSLETADDVAEYAPKIEALHLDFDVWLTSDKQVLPKLTFVEIPGKKRVKAKDLFRHIFGF